MDSVMRESEAVASANNARSTYSMCTAKKNSTALGDVIDIAKEIEIGKSRIGVFKKEKFQEFEKFQNKT